METFEENNTCSVKSVILERVHRQCKEYKLLFLATIYNFPGTWFLMLDGFIVRKSVDYHQTERAFPYVSVM